MIVPIWEGTILDGKNGWCRNASRVQNADVHYGCPQFDNLEYIGIDEFAVSKGHVYKTIVVNLLNGQVVYIGQGKGMEALEGFWKKVNKSGVVIKAVATDLSGAFISSVLQNAPQATLVFDHFHVVKLMNDTLDIIRRNVYKIGRAHV